MNAVLTEVVPDRAPDVHRVGALLIVACAASWALGLVLSKEALDVTGGASTVVLAAQLLASVAALAIVCSVRHIPVSPSLRDGWSGLLEPGLAYQLALAGLARRARPAPP